MNQAQQNKQPNQPQNANTPAQETSQKEKQKNLVKTLMETKLSQSFEPSFLSLENESQQHSGFYEGKESHFKLVLVSDAFENKRLVQRHQLVYATVASELTSGGGNVHALAIHAYTPLEWQQQSNAPASPNCKGGSQ